MVEGGAPSAPLRSWEEASGWRGALIVAGDCGARLRTALHTGEKRGRRSGPLHVDLRGWGRYSGWDRRLVGPVGLPGVISVPAAAESLQVFAEEGQAFAQVQFEILGPKAVVFSLHPDERGVDASFFERLMEAG